MRQNKITILSTRRLQPEIINQAEEKNTLIEAISFIETEPIINQELKENISRLFQQSSNVVFTSMNAVESVASHLNNIKPDWKIFCIGSATKKLVKEYFGENVIAGTADSASGLADEIINQKNISSVVFFCGDNRRDELPEKLKQQRIEVNEIEVYKTVQINEQLTKDYDAILFYSPSAVNSFFSGNKISNKTILFAIGNTTASQIKKFAANKIIIANEPSKELLAEQAINYFQTNLTHY